MHTLRAPSEAVRAPAPLGGRETIPDEPRLLARQHILEISLEQPTDFLAIAEAPYAISLEDWNFESYHAAASAAVLEDIKLNKIIYRLVPRRCTEEEFWRCALQPSRSRHNCCAKLRLKGWSQQQASSAQPRPTDADAERLAHAQQRAQCRDEAGLRDIRRARGDS